MRASRAATDPRRPSNAAAETRSILRNIAVCYILSGATGLIYQILWLRKLLLVFGSTVHAVSTVLTVFFGGLAIGSGCLAGSSIGIPVRTATVAGGADRI